MRHGTAISAAIVSQSPAPLASRLTHSFERAKQLWRMCLVHFIVCAGGERQLLHFHHHSRSVAVRFCEGMLMEKDSIVRNGEFARAEKWKEMDVLAKRLRGVLFC